MSTEASKTVAPKTSAPVKVHAKLIALRDQMIAAFKERGHIVDGVLSACLAGEHVVLIGLPGTAKSALARALCAGIKDSRYFEWLLTRFTEPNELFGPIDLHSWSQGGTYTRRMAGMAPDAHFVFFDEIYKANSSILNANLSLISERVFHDAGKVIKVPLRMCLGASNELPTESELEALHDRFMLRFLVDYVQEPASFAAIITGADPVITPTLTLAEMDQAVAEAAALPLDPDLVDAMFTLRQTLQQEGIVASDRRWKKLLKVMRGYAYLLGDVSVGTLHLEILVDGLWRDARERTKLVGVLAKVASPGLAEANEVFDAIMEQVTSLPATGSIKAQGPTVAAEMKKASKRLVELQAAATTPGIGARIGKLVDEVRNRQKDITQRVMAEMNLD